MNKEAQLLLTNPHEALRDQSRSSKLVPFHMLGIVSSCAILIFSLRRAVFLIFDFKNAVTLKTGSELRKGHWKCHHAIECIRLGLSRVVSQIFSVEKCDLEIMSKVTQEI